MPSIGAPATATALQRSPHESPEMTAAPVAIVREGQHGALIGAPKAVAEELGTRLEQLLCQQAWAVFFVAATPVLELSACRDVQRRLRVACSAGRHGRGVDGAARHVQDLTRLQLHVHVRRSKS